MVTTCLLQLIVCPPHRVSVVSSGRRSRVSSSIVALEHTSTMAGALMVHRI